MNKTWKKRRRKVKSGDLADFQAFLRVFRLLSLLRRSVRTKMTRTDSGGPSILSDSAECRRLCENMIKYNGKNISVVINVLKSVKSDGAAFVMEWKRLNLQEKPYAAKSIWRSFSDGRILRVWKAKHRKGCPLHKDVCDWQSECWHVGQNST